MNRFTAALGGGHHPPAIYHGARAIPSPKKPERALARIAIHEYYCPKLCQKQDRNTHWCVRVSAKPDLQSGPPALVILTLVAARVLACADPD